MSTVLLDINHAAPASIEGRTDARMAIGHRFFKWLSLVLLGYAVGGRGFAYFGIPPLFVGEITLIIGLCIYVRCRTWSGVLEDKRFLPLIALCMWGAMRTLPYVSTYGIDAVRDAVVWGYAIYAFVIAALLLECPGRLSTFVGRYRRFVPLFLCLTPVVFTIYRLLGQTRPEWPWASVPIFQVKEGDVLVHLSGVLAFWVSGLGGKIPWKYVLFLTINAAVMGVIDRAGMVALGLVFSLCLLFKPMHTVGLRMMGTVVVCIAILWATDIRVPIVGGKGREVSFDQIVTNITSVLGDTGSDGLDSTKEWRLDWWKDIVNYTVHGKYFWTGKGFGINIADDDGYQVLSDNSLRNPHDVHMTFLARSGVPGAALWGLTQILWAGAMAAAFLRARAARRENWTGLFFFLFCYWAALLLNGSFDVFLEGPPGGIWFWCVYGTGLGAIGIYRRTPDAFTLTTDDDSTKRPALA